MKKSYLSALALFFIVPLSSNAQVNSLEYMRNRHHETPNDSYIPIDKTTMETGPAYSHRTATVFTTQVNVDEFGDNIIGDAANEPSLAVDPTNPNRIVIGWRQFNTISNNFRQAGHGYSTDAGLSWTAGILDQGVFRSDPVLDFDADGNFYYNSLVGDLNCSVFAIKDGSTLWGPPIQAGGGDKQWMTVDKGDGSSRGNIYALWDIEFSSCTTGAFTRSFDASESYDTCSEVPEEPFFGTLTIDRNGDLYYAGASFIANGTVLLKSTDAKNESAITTWETLTTVDLDGNVTADQPINPVGLLGQIWVAADNSLASERNNIYVLSTVKRFSNDDPADVMFAKSTDGGQTFAPPIRINTDSGTEAYQWFGTLSVAPNGRIDVIWLDTRDASTTNPLMSRLYYSFSDDQGENWSDNEAISAPFDPTLGYPSQEKIGDYIDMVSDNQIAHVAWTATYNGEQDVYYTSINPESTLDIDDFVSNIDEIRVYPNPFQESITIKLPQQLQSPQKIEIYDISGRKIKTLSNRNAQGSSIIWKGTNDQNQLTSNGIYFISIQGKSSIHTVKVLKQ